MSYNSNFQSPIVRTVLLVTAVAFLVFIFSKYYKGDFGGGSQMENFALDAVISEDELRNQFGVPVSENFSSMEEEDDGDEFEDEDDVEDFYEEDEDMEEFEDDDEMTEDFIDEEDGGEEFEGFEDDGDYMEEYNDDEDY